MPERKTLIGPYQIGDKVFTEIPKGNKPLKATIVDFDERANMYQVEWHTDVWAYSDEKINRGWVKPSDIKERS